MIYTLLAVLLLVVVVLKFWSPFGQRCPQCQTRREDARISLVSKLRVDLRSAWGRRRGFCAGRRRKREILRGVKPSYCALFAA